MAVETTHSNFKRQKSPWELTKVIIIHAVGTMNFLSDSDICKFTELMWLMKMLNI